MEEGSGRDGAQDGRGGTPWKISWFQVPSKGKFLRSLPAGSEAL